MKSKLPYLVSLIISIIFTLLTHFKVIPHSFRQPTYSSYKTIYDFMYIVFFGWGLLSLGVFFEKRSSFKKVSLICPKCEYSEEVLKCVQKNSECIKCGSKMVDLKGFYD